MSDKLSDAIRTIIDEAQRLHGDDFEAAIDAVNDELTTGERDDDLYTESVVDGIRWGVRAAVTVDLGQSTLLRICTADGVRISHEWDRSQPMSEEARAMILRSVETAMGPALPEPRKD